MISPSTTPSPPDIADVAAALSTYWILEEEIAKVQARQLRALEVYSRRATSRRAATAEVARTLSLTTAEAERKIALAQTLVRRLPGTLAAMERGEITEHQAAEIAEAITRAGGPS
ncbi:DUF222 domain-containing protein [Amycolatopsis sp. NPDC059027]|uniref:DUF222 domain-containing protein n=1 Tax=Amycolatopsis sp. NPDC059027 TaxID=3346709 RepID=UPI00366AE2CB